VIDKAKHKNDHLEEIWNAISTYQNNIEEAAGLIKKQIEELKNRHKVYEFA